MSNVSNVRDVIPFVAGKTAAITGQRLAKVGYKSSTDKVTKKIIPAKFPSVAVSVPFLSDDSIRESMDSLLPYIKGMMESTQDAVIRSLYESKDGTLKTVQDHEISVQACIAYLDSEAAGDRIKKEHIEAWFDRVCAENVFVLIAEKLGYSGDSLTPEQSATVDKHVKVYREILSMLAGGRTALTPVQIKSCKTVIDVSEDDSGIGVKLMQRLTAMESPKPIAEFLEL
jgi:hypothetical protein